MTFTEAINSGFSNYANFTGRAARSEFWYWTLFTVLVGIVADLIDYVIGSGSVVGGLWGLATLLPGLAVAARRLHDTERSAFWLFLIILVLIGWIILFVWYCLKGTTGPNKYGPDPLGVA